MLIRPATPDDAAAITAIYNDAIASTTAVMWNEPKAESYWGDRLVDRPAHLPVLVADRGGGQAAAFTTLGPYDTLCGYSDVAEWSLYVGADDRGRGVGTALAEALVDTARSHQKLHSIVSRVTAGNAPSEKLHRRLGFREVGTLQRVGHKFGRRHDVRVYQLVL